MIFTYIWAFDQQSDWDYVEHVKSIFRPYDTEFYCVELIASLGTSLQEIIPKTGLQARRASAT